MEGNSFDVPATLHPTDVAPPPGESEFFKRSRALGKGGRAVRLPVTGLAPPSQSAPRGGQDSSQSRLAARLGGGAG